MDYSTTGSEEHRRLEEYAQTRFAELTVIFQDEIQVVTAYEKLMCRATLILGEHEPRDTADRAIRDLLADSFDALYTARRVVSEGYGSAAWPLMRRAFESITLIEYFTLVPKKATEWNQGKRIKHGSVRKYLNTHPVQLGGKAMSQYEKRALKELYSEYSEATHPNRSALPSRFLGAGNSFVLGAIGMPEPLAVAHHFLRLIDLWFFLAALVSYNYREILDSADDLFVDDYFAAAAKARQVSEALRTQWRQLWESRYGNGLPAPPDPLS